VLEGFISQDVRPQTGAAQFTVLIEHHCLERLASVEVPLLVRLNQLLSSFLLDSIKNVQALFLACAEQITLFSTWSVRKRLLHFRDISCREPGADGL